jgi:hypothetical protein
MNEVSVETNLRHTIVAFQAAIEQGITDGTVVDRTADCVIRHYFIPGGYAREMTAPAGLIIVGKIHKYQCLNVISKGHILVATEFGNKAIVAPHTFVSEAGVKRVGLTVEETVWTTFHVTDETDVAKIEEALTVAEYEELPCLEPITKELP